MWDKASFFASLFQALYLVHSPEDTSFAELFSTSLRCRIGDYLRSSLNLYYLRGGVWLLASGPGICDGGRKQWPPPAGSVNVCISMSV